MKLTDILGWIVVAYLGLFCLWAMMITACVTTQDVCGGDMLTGLVRTIYPVFLLK